MKHLTRQQQERYDRQIRISGIAESGQIKLLNARVLIIGAGGLGSASAFYLAAAGCGTIGLADPDKVSLSNLQRQILYSFPDIGKKKVISAGRKLRALNPDILVKTFPERAETGNIKELIKPFDFIIDATDNFKSKYLTNDTCLFLKKPFTIAGVTGWEGQIMTYLPGKACYRCFFPREPAPGIIPDTGQAGILGCAAGLLGIMQAAEAIKFILNKKDLLTDRILYVNSLTMKFHEASVKTERDCPVCHSKRA
ncbi:MAG: HesA/MoeB/ThiF family protein [bacterium]|nr:HesA/MoeB/ThiF family protein [bacterium]